MGRPRDQAIPPPPRYDGENPSWKGDDVGYAALHDYIKRRLPRPRRCQDCNKVKSLDLANISQEYKRDLSDWEWLCRKCHLNKDGRLSRMQQAAVVARRSKTHCIHGHEYTPSNTYYEKRNGARHCKTCHKLRGRKVLS